MAQLLLRTRRDIREALRPLRNRLRDIEPIGDKLVDDMRRGDGGVRAQFDASAEFTAGGATVSWPPTKAFGDVGAGPSTLVRTGSYRAAWLGGPGSRESKFKNGVAVGVESRKFPQVNVFQGTKPFVISRAKRKTRKGRFKMPLYLLRVYGVFALETKIRRRPISINPRMLDTMGESVLAWVARGKR